MRRREYLVTAGTVVASSGCTSSSSSAPLEIAELEVPESVRPGERHSYEFLVRNPSEVDRRLRVNVVRRPEGSDEWRTFETGLLDGPIEAGSSERWATGPTNLDRRGSWAVTLQSEQLQDVPVRTVTVVED